MLWLNKGYTCRQLMPSDRRFTACALEAFSKLKQVAPRDPRGERALHADAVRRRRLRGAGDDLPRAGARGGAARRHGSRRRDRPSTSLLQAGQLGARAVAGRARRPTRGPAMPRRSTASGAFIWQLLSSRGGGNGHDGVRPPAESSASSGWVKRKAGAAPHRRRCSDRKTSAARCGSSSRTRAFIIWKERWHCTRATRRR